MPMLLVISGPTAVGKATLIKELLKRDSTIRVPVSFTTRLPRLGEVDGIDYHFVTKEKFLDLRNKDYFIEWAEYSGNFYGTPTGELGRETGSGQDILIEIECQGARQIKEKFPSAILIFILPPTFSSLEERIRGRGTENEMQIQSRLKTAREELDKVKEFDYWITNSRVEDAVTDLAELIRILRKGGKPNITRYRNKSLLV